MKFGVFLPISGRATGPDTLREAARSAEALGFDAVWAADRVVTPWQINTFYPYSENHECTVRTTSLLFHRTGHSWTRSPAWLSWRA